MPVLSWAHSQYWQIQPDAPDPSPGFDFYPLWQTSVISGSMFGGLQPVYEWIVWRATTTKPVTR